MSLDVDPIAAVKHPWLAGLAGSLIALKFAPGSGWLERVFNLTCGTLCAGFVAPYLSEWLGVKSVNGEAALAFGVGLFGLSVAAAAMQALRDLRLAEILQGWMSRKG